MKTIEFLKRYWRSGSILFFWLLTTGCQSLPSLESFNYVRNNHHPDVRLVLERCHKMIKSLPESERGKILPKILEEIIGQDPDWQVRELGDMLREKKIMLMFQTGGNMAFGEMPAKDVPTASKLPGGRDFYPVLLVSPALLVDLKKESQVLDIMVMLEHEMMHYQQWLIRQGDQEIFRLLYNRGTGQIKSLPASACRDIWQLEKEAYAGTCRLLNEWQYDSQLNAIFCQSADELEFELKLRDLFISQVFSGFTECHSEWKINR